MDTQLLVENTEKTYEMSGTELTSPVLEFYRGAKILITGGTGFLGKCLVYKLLRVCSDLDHIYLLIRKKKGNDSRTRLAEMLTDPIFNKLRDNQLDFDKKITCIGGDITSPKLGISDEEFEFLTREITHVFHSAATVRFKEKLKTALRINVLGLRETVEFCNKCLQLKVFVHVSTAFCYNHEIFLKEELREAPLLGENSLSLMKIFSEEQLEAITPSLIKSWPNTYSFTKAIAENFVEELVKDYPVVIFRPSIVMGSHAEPVPGWIDNINGPTGIVVAVGTGIMRTLWANESKHANLVPVDMAINALLCCAWEVGRDCNNNAVSENGLTKNSEFPIKKKLKVYNYVAREENGITWGDFLKINLKFGVQYPVSDFIWYYTITLTRIKMIFCLLTVLFHFLPAVFMDFGAILLGKKPMLIKTYKKVYTFSKVLSAFSLHQWHFSDNNTRELWKNLSETDKKLFHFNMSDVDWQSYMENVIMGIRCFIFKEKDSDLPQARRKMFFFWLAHRLFQFVIGALFLWFISRFFFKLDIFKDDTLNESIMMTPKLLGNFS